MLKPDCGHIESYGGIKPDGDGALTAVYPDGNG